MTPRPSPGAGRRDGRGPVAGSSRRRLGNGAFEDVDDGPARHVARYSVTARRFRNFSSGRSPPYKDTGRVFLGCNKAFEDFIGRSRDGIIGKTVYDVAPKDLADVYREADEVLLRNSGPGL
jgi:hypothetical protein